MKTVRFGSILSSDTFTANVKRQFIQFDSLWFNNPVEKLLITLDRNSNTAIHKNKPL